MNKVLHVCNVSEPDYTKQLCQISTEISINNWLQEGQQERNEGQVTYNQETETNNIVSQ
jgi:hypothetical protein